MEREVTYTLNKEFVYKGTKGLEKVKPGILLISGEKYSFHMHRFFESLYIRSSMKYGTTLKGLLKLPVNIKELSEIDLTQYPIMLLELNVQTSNNNICHLFNCMGKEVVLYTASNFHKPLHFIGHSL